MKALELKLLFMQSGFESIEIYPGSNLSAKKSRKNLDCF